MWLLLFHLVGFSSGRIWKKNSSFQKYVMGLQKGIHTIQLVAAVTFIQYFDINISNMEPSPTRAVNSKSPVLNPLPLLTVPFATGIGNMSSVEQSQSRRQSDCTISECDVSVISGKLYAPSVTFSLRVLWHQRRHYSVKVDPRIIYIRQSITTGYHCFCLMKFPCKNQMYGVR